MSFFDSLKKSIGLKKEPPTTKPGRVLGNGKPAETKESQSPTSPTYQVFEKIFHDEKIGIGLVEFKEKLPIDSSDRVVARPAVVTIAPDSESHRHGIQQGDVILSLNGQELTQFEDFYNFIVALGRPLTIK
jgi:membrane-associated protease RseP (regulator of RpoE activity)